MITTNNLQTFLIFYFIFYGDNMEIKTYGKPTIRIKPYQIRQLINRFKIINLLLALLIVGLYPFPLAYGINKLIDKIKIKNVWRF